MVNVQNLASKEKMIEKVRIPLTKLEMSATGKVVEIIGGFGMQKKLENMGIRIGTEIKKISAQFLRGPVVVMVGNTQVAIGFGMARKIIIEKESS